MPSDEAPKQSGEQTTVAEPKHLPPEAYKGRLRPIWCPGCGNFGILRALTQALSDLEVDPDNLAVISGIGCSSRIPGFLKCYGFHGVHGRALPLATGVKLGNPRLTVIVASGDGDALSIGAGHLPHAIRRNIDITLLLMDNRIYGLTKGQTSPTTMEGVWTKTAPYGVLEMPVDPVSLAINYGATFVARCFTQHLKVMRELIVKAVQHKGFSMVHILTPCVTFGRFATYDYFKERVKPLPGDYTPSDPCEAYNLARQQEPIYEGVFLDVEAPEYIETLRRIGSARGREIGDDAPDIDSEMLIKRFS